MLRMGACLITLEVFCIVVLAPSLSLRILGGICACLSITVTASPLVALEDIFRSQSVESMQTDMVVICFCGSCAWATMGFLMGDICIALPNCFGVVIGGIQVHLILKYSDVGMWKMGSMTGDSVALLPQLG